MPNKLNLILLFFSRIAWRLCALCPKEKKRVDKNMEYSTYKEIIESEISFFNKRKEKFEKKFKEKEDIKSKIEVFHCNEKLRQLEIIKKLIDEKRFPSKKLILIEALLDKGFMPTFDRYYDFLRPEFFILVGDHNKLRIRVNDRGCMILGDPGAGLRLERIFFTPFALRKDTFKISVIFSAIEVMRNRLLKQNYIEKLKEDGWWIRSD